MYTITLYVCKVVTSIKLIFSLYIEDAPLSEKLHVLALDAMVSGRYREAAVVYETILLHDHRDLLALRCSFDLYLMLGYVSLCLTVLVWLWSSLKDELLGGECNPFRNLIFCVTEIIRTFSPPSLVGCRPGHQTIQVPRHSLTDPVAVRLA